MSEYIEKAELIKKLCFETAEWYNSPTIKTIKEFPAADVQPVDRWISVDDRLPESEKEVLVWYKYTWDAGFTSYGFGINVWHSNTKQWRDGCLLKGVEVLYWQSLPEPPKEEK